MSFFKKSAKMSLKNKTIIWEELDAQDPPREPQEIILLCIVDSLSALQRATLLFLLVLYCINKIYAVRSRYKAYYIETFFLSDDFWQCLSVPGVESNTKAAVLYSFD